MTPVVALLACAMSSTVTGPAPFAGELRARMEALRLDGNLHATLTWEAPWWNLAVSHGDVRARVTSSHWESILASVAPLAEELLHGTAAVLARNDLATLLGTDDEGVQLLRRHVGEHPGVSLVDAWTLLLAIHNRRAAWLSPSLGATLLAGGLAIMALSGVTGVLGILMTTGALPGTQSHRLVSHPSDAATVASSFPVFTAILWDASFLAPMVAGAVALAAAVGITQLPAHPTRIHVSPSGGCRDERQWAALTAPSPLERMAPYLAAVGGLAGIQGTLGYLVAAALMWPLISVVTVVAGRTVHGPTLPLGSQGTLAALVVVSGVFMVGFWLATVPFGSAALVAAVVMMHHQQPSPLDE